LSSNAASIADIHQKMTSLLRNKLDRSSYSWWVQLSRLKFPFNKDKAMQFAVGGEFEAFGFVEMELLRYVGLNKGDYVIDVGCGAGRLAKPLAEFFDGRYL
jgi:2-polyprenyl-3-methyl-5-hydroxy-6-metoxy-1,4-benzoquinol methylase